MPELLTSSGIRLCPGSTFPGLHFTRKIAQAHSGNIFVCSDKGAGATFALQIPQPDESS